MVTTVSALFFCVDARRFTWVYLVLSTSIYLAACLGTGHAVMGRTKNQIGSHSEERRLSVRSGNCVYKL